MGFFNAIKAIRIGFLDRDQIYDRCYTAQANPVRAWVRSNVPGGACVLPGMSLTKLYVQYFYRAFYQQCYSCKNHSNVKNFADDYKSDFLNASFDRFFFALSCTADQDS